MAFTVDYDRLLLTFDNLVAQGMINHHASRVTRLVDKGYAFEIHVSQSLLTKPQAEEGLAVPEETVTATHDLRPACFGPGSDIANDHPDMLIRTVHDTHLLIFNKFCVFRPQLLLLTADSYRRQDEPLSLPDFAAVWAVLNGMKAPHYAMFNCGATAGASRKHKHVQIIPQPEATEGFCFFPDRGSALEPETVPFRYYLRYFRDRLSEKPIDAGTLLAVYEDLLARSRDVLGLSDDAISCPHNFMMTKQWMIAIPRTNIEYHHATANTAGMMGSVWLMHEGQLEDLRKLGPSNVLAQLGVVADSSKEDPTKSKV